jgi:hypothetical protein
MYGRGEGEHHKDWVFTPYSNVKKKTRRKKVKEGSVELYNEWILSEQKDTTHETEKNTTSTLQIVTEQIMTKVEAIEKLSPMKQETEEFRENSTVESTTKQTKDHKEEKKNA